MTPLIGAASAGDFEWQASPILLALLEKGADVNAKTTNGRTPLMFAASKGSTFAVAELLNRGANVNASDQDGFTALMLASPRYPAIVLALLAAGADVNARTRDGKTAISLAGGPEILELLMTPRERLAEGVRPR